MRSVEENIEALSRAMLSEAKVDAEAILAEAMSNADGIRQRAQEQADAERQDILDRARQESDRLRSQAIATTQLKARTMELDHREKLLERVFSQAMQQVPSVQQWTDYEEISKRLLREAVMQIRSSKVKVRADERTRKFLTDQALAELGKEMKTEIQFEKALEKGTGVVVSTDDGHLVYDNTLETRLSRLQNALRAPVYRTLIGETI
jgi:V/A-type H+-transporting ATPase subunit E